MCLFPFLSLPSWPLRNTVTWSVKKSLSISRRFPPLVAMGTVIFIITPWIGKKPRFCTCSQRRVSACTVEGWEQRTYGDQSALKISLSRLWLLGP